MIPNDFQLGDAVEHRGIVVAPLFPRRDPVADYVTLDEALPRGLRITEVDEAGSVPELVVENPLDERVLLYDGEELVGAKQNRILNVSVLVEAKSTLRIPVSCVEQGRWSHIVAVVSLGQPRLARAPAPAQGRGAGRAPMARGVAQSQCGASCASGWSTCPSTRRRVRAPISIALASATSGRSRTRSRRSRASAAPSSGSVTTCASTSSLGRTRSRDSGRSSAPATCSTRSSASTAGRRRSRSMPTFLRWVDEAEAARQPSVGLGEDVRLRGEHVIGSGLELDGELIQLSAFTSRDGGRRAFGRIARPSARPTWSRDVAESRRSAFRIRPGAHVRNVSGAACRNYGTPSVLRLERGSHGACRGVRCQ